MKKILSTILLLFVVFIASCQNKTDIVISGEIVDEMTGKPIPNAEVMIFCWFKSFNDVSFKKQILKTNDEGKYQATFDKGYKVDIASKAVGYLPKRSYNKLKNNKIKINLKLSQVRSNPTLIALNLDSDKEDPMLRVHIPAKKDNNELDFKNATTFGFDFQSLTTISDTTRTDIWFRLEDKEISSDTLVNIMSFEDKEIPPTTLVTSIKGGLIPIFSNEIESSLLYEKNTAPTKGYVTSYKLTGSELGFFVRCRDGKTYGKIILGASEIDLSSPDGQGSYYKEFGRSFIYLYQPNGTTNLAYYHTDIDLENFLLNIIRFR